MCAIKRPQKWRSSFKRDGRREGAKVCVRKRGHKSGAAVLNEAGGERERRCACEKEATKVAQEFHANCAERRRAKGGVLQRGHKSGAGVYAKPGERHREQRGGGGVLQRGHKSGAAVLREAGGERERERERAKVRVRKRGHKCVGEKRAKVCVRERGNKSGAAVSSNSDMQIGVPAEYCTTQNAKLVPNESNFQHWVS